MRFLSHTTIRRTAPARLGLAVLICGAMQSAGCGGKTPLPPPPPTTLSLSCPETIVRDATSPEGTDVHFELPAPTGGEPPYTVECSPGSSSIFPIGDSTVTCKATDSTMRQASCEFIVTVRVPQTLMRTKFLAFGDSITEGTMSLQPLIMLGEPETYPFKLLQMLLQRYPTQMFVVTNAGQGGENTSGGGRRLPGVLDAEKPDVLLLLEGVNAGWILSTAVQESNIRSMILAAQQRHVDVIVATVMPIDPQKFPQRPNWLPRIIALNTQIFELADQFGLGNVVDLYALFDANPQLLGSDGLHPTAEGQTRIAEAFRDEIVHRYESRATMTSRLRRLSARDAR